MNGYFTDFFIEMKFGLVGMLLNPFAAMLVPVLFYELDSKSIRSWLILFAHMIMCALLMTLFCYLYYFISSKGMPQICGAFVTVLYALVFCRKTSIPARIMMTISYISINMNVFVICFSISDLLKMAASPGEQVISVLLNVIIMTSCVLFFRAFSVNKLTEVPFLSIALVCIVGAINIVFWILSNVFEIDPAWDIIIGIIAVVLLIFAYFSAYTITNNINKSNNNRAQAIMEMADERLMRISEENLESMRKMRHELKNEYAYMHMLLCNKEYDKLDAYFSEYESSLKRTTAYIDCGNSTINAIISVEEGRAKRSGVRLDCRIQVPSELPIKDIELCAIIMNLINNAVEYYDRCPDLEDKVVGVVIRVINNTLLIEANNKINSGDEKTALALETSKADKHLHGYGVKIVKDVTRRYNGEVSYTVEDGQCIARAMLFLPDAPAEDKK